jgi:hypothetical protein
VATAAGALVRDFTHYEGGAVTAGSGKLYLPTGFRELIETNVAASTPPRQIGLCKTYAGATSRVDAVAIRGSKLFVADSGMPGICQVDLNSGAATPVYTAKVGQGVNQYMEWGPTGMAFDGKDLFMVASRTGEIIRFDPAAPGSKPTTVSVKTPLRRPWGIVALDGALYVTSRDDNVVVRIDPKSGSVHTIGDGLPATRDGQGGKASLCHPLGLATDGAYLYVGEAFCPTRDGQFHGNAIRQIDIATEEVTTLVGPGGDSVVVPGSGSRAGVNFPAALTHDATTRALYVADSWENVLLKVD